MSFNRKTTTYAFDSVTTALRRALNEHVLDDMLVEAHLTYKDATAGTKRKWMKVAEKVRAQLRIKALQPPTPRLLDARGQVIE